jgi:hypothetical protein
VYCCVVDLDRSWCWAPTAGAVAGPGGLATEDCTDEDPQFCDPIACDMAPTSGGDYRVAEGSVCLPDRSPCGSPIGGQGEGCTATPKRRESWSGSQGYLRGLSHLLHRSPPRVRKFSRRSLG